MKIPQILIDVKNNCILMYTFCKEESSDFGFELKYKLKTFTVGSLFKYPDDSLKEKTFSQFELAKYKNETINDVVNLSSLSWKELKDITHSKFIKHNITTDANGNIEEYILEDLKTQFKVRVEDPESHSLLIDIIDKNYALVLDNRAMVTQADNIKKLLSLDLQFKATQSVINNMKDLLDTYVEMLKLNDIVVDRSNIKLYDENDSTSISLSVFAEQLRILLTLEMVSVMSIEAEDEEDERMITSIVNILMSIHSYAFNILVTGITGNAEQG